MRSQIAKGKNWNEELETKYAGISLFVCIRKRRERSEIFISALQIIDCIILAQFTIFTNLMNLSVNQQERAFELRGL